MKTIAQQINWDFGANGSLEIKNKNGKRIYLENSDGFWVKREYDFEGKEIYYENSDGYWAKQGHDSEGNLIYYENSDEFWAKYEYDSKGNEIYFENSDGTIKDNRPKSCENKEIEIDDVKYKLVKQ